MDSPTVHLTVEQAAQQAGVSTKTVRRMIRGGELVPGRAGQSYVIDLTALTTALAARRARAQLSMDSRSVQSSAPGLATLSSVEAVRDLVQQAVRIELAPVLDRLDRVLVERDQLVEQVRVLSERPISGDSDNDAAEPTQRSSEASRGRPWWRFWQATPAT